MMVAVTHTKVDLKTGTKERIVAIKPQRKKPHNSNRKVQ
jgi:hypothetical protein